MRSLATNVRDLPSKVNVNALRSVRLGGHLDVMPVGGRLYGPQVLCDNWVEERQDATYRLVTLLTSKLVGGAYCRFVGGANKSAKHPVQRMEPGPGHNLQALEVAAVHLCLAATCW